jgi:NAD(P)-dependent dehydrogenase (short-subunit alcohol dehydrogenase family)
MQVPVKYSGEYMPQDMSGKYCLVTGANSGIGKEISLALLKTGAHVTMVCRDPGRGKGALEEIRYRSGNKSADLIIADLASQKQIRAAGRDYLDRYDKLHVLVNNAGIVMDNRVLTEDGIEMTFAVNYLAYFLLTNLLIGVLKNSAPSRVVNLSSMAHRAAKIDFDNLQGEKGYTRDSSYARSKLADILFTYELARRLERTGVTVNCVCPGAVYSTLWEESSKIVNGFFKLFMKGPEEGARLPVYLARSPEVEGISCRYFQTKQHLKFQHVNPRGTITRSSMETYKTDVAKKLWAISEKLTGQFSNGYI